MEVELIAALLARLGGTADISAVELDTAKSFQVSWSRNPVTGDLTLSLREKR